MSEIYGETARMELRRLTPADLDRLAELDNDPGVKRFIDGGKPPDREEIRRNLLEPVFAAYERWAEFGWWIALEKSTGEFLGRFGLYPSDPAAPTSVVLGYRLRATAWGRGYATEGARFLVEKGFRELGVERITAETMTVNTGSRRVMEKAGLRYVRTFFQDWPETIEGSELGDVEYAVTRAEWVARATAGDSD